MEDFLIYIFKGAGIISLFYLFYFLLLRKETAFESNRKFLAVGMLSSLVLPGMYFTKTVFIEPPQNSSPFSPQVYNYAIPVPQENPIDWWEIATLIYAVVAGAMLLKLLFRIYKATKLVWSSAASTSGNYYLIEDRNNTGAFSFFRYIFYNPDLHGKEELKMILQHEKVHAAQFHSIDIILANFITAMLWFNPFAWLYKKCVEENLEYIADSKTAALSGSRKKYQQTLIKVAVPDFHPALTNHFYQSFIKKRIVMLNKNINPRPKLWKISLILPLLLGFMLFFNVKTEAQITHQKDTSEKVSRKALSVIIDKNTTDQQLEDFSEAFKKENINLEFKDIERSAEGYLVDITTKFEDNNSGKHGELSLKKKEGIAPFTFYTQANGTIGLHPVENQDRETSAAVEIANVAEGEEQEKRQITGKGIVTSEANNRTDSLKSSSASGSHLYGYGSKSGTNVSISRAAGSSANAGAARLKIHSIAKDSLNLDDVNVIIDGKVIENFDEEEINPESIAQIQVINSRNAKDSLIITSKNASVGTGGSKVIIAHRKNQQKPRPLFVVDGKIKSENFDAENINPDEIDHINVLKGKQATDKYGAKGKNGVVVIFIKEDGVAGNSTSAANYWYINSDYSDEALENIRKTLKNKKNLDVKFSGVKRNKEGKITAISISASAKGKSASASFSQSNEIPEVVIGMDKEENLLISSSKFHWQKN